MRPITLVKLCDVSAIVKQVCMEYVLMRSSLEMDQFYKGLETLGIGYLVRTRSAVMKQLFVSDNQGVITVRKLQELLSPDFSPRASNIRGERSHYYELE